MFPLPNVSISGHPGTMNNAGLALSIGAINTGSEESVNTQY
jgi:hypothetical protein